MKRMTAIFLSLLLVLTLSGCAGRAKDLLGDWAIAYGEAGRFGYMIRFAKSGEFFCTPGYDSAIAIGNLDAAYKQTRRSMQLEYELISDRRMRVQVLVLGEKIKMTIAYTLEGDSLLFDGCNYRRVS